MYLFDTLEVGRELGRHSATVDDRMVADWAAVFPEEPIAGGQAPPGLMAVITMNAFMGVVSPRPPGNVHGTQVYEVARLPDVGETLETSVTCVEKSLRNGRRWVTFETATTGAEGAARFNGRMTLLWAK